MEQIDPDWACGLSIGVTGGRLPNLQGPINAIGLKQYTWVVTGEYVLKNGRKVSKDTNFF